MDELSEGLFDESPIPCTNWIAASMNELSEGLFAVSNPMGLEGFWRDLIFIGQNPYQSAPMPNKPWLEEIGCSCKKWLLLYCLV